MACQLVGLGDLSTKLLVVVALGSTGAIMRSGVTNVNSTNARVGSMVGVGSPGMASLVRVT